MSDSTNFRMPVHRSQKKIRLCVSEPILRLAERLAEERRLRRNQMLADPPLAVPDDCSTVEPSRLTYDHKRITAVLSLGVDGFALDNGVNCVIENAGPSQIVEELVKMHVRILYCFNLSTYQECLKMQKDSSKLAKVKMIQLKPFPIRSCNFCAKDTCAIWNVNAGIAHLLKIPFDPVEHSATLVPEKKLIRHKKIAAVLAIGTDGFTLTNGVESVSQNKSLNNSSIVQEVMKMDVRILNCFDLRTFNMWTDVQQCYKNHFPKLKASLMDEIKMRKCNTCNNMTCHKWKASVGISNRYKLKFDPIKH